MIDNISETQPTLTPGLTQWERVSNTFTAPSKTFNDIAAGNKSWWLPFLIMLVFSYLFFGAIQMKIGWPQVAENAMHMNAKAEEKLAQAPPETREQALKVTQYSIEGSFLASPLVVLAASAIISLVLWGTINFIFAGKATFPAIFSVWMFASLPGTIKAILGSIVAFFTAPESFNIQNFAPTSIGAFLSPTDTNAAIYKLATALDVTTIWSMALLAIGVAAVARVKRSSGYIAVFGWWGLLTLISVGWAAIFG
ncbi:MAG: YIP1 family protein [Terracidiphilus sp.]|nr:YIP1 family protein [Terracidiphilus sp.]